MRLHKLLTRKITRQRLDSFVVAQGNELFTLDLGCANSPYSKHFPNRVGCDISPGEGVDVVADAHDLPFRNEYFEQVFCTEALEHFHTPEKALQEMHRVLKPGGRLVLTTRFIFPIHDAPHDYYRYTKYGLQHLLRDWELISLEPETQTMESIAVLFQRIGFQTTLRLNIASKILVFLVAKLCMILQWMIKDEYGNIQKTRHETCIMTSGYYLVAKKR